MKKLLLAITFLSAAALYADVPLMKNGKPVCTIIPAPGENPTFKYAAEELALYLGKIGGGTAPAIAAKAEKGKSSVVFRLDKNPKIGKHGFQLETKGNTLYIRAQKPLGLLYGAYEILKKYGGIRWIHPGPKGEFFKVKSAITIPDINKISNPSFTTRTFHFGIANWVGPFEPTWDWMVRNNMHVEWDAGGSLARVRPKMYGHAVKLGATWRCGWHCFTRLHMGEYTAEDKKQCLADYRKMFQEHPERFALIKGKRQGYNPKKQLAFQCQPCITNKDNIRIIAHNLVETVRMIQRTYKQLDPDGRFFMSNNDTTAWCECPECLAAADPEEVKTRHISTRYWKFVNAVVAEARKEMPDIPISGVSYQNFHPAPRGVKPAHHVPVMIGFNDICYRHKLDDPACPVNTTFYQYYKEWGKVNSNPSTWEEVGDIGMHYQALEFIYANHLKVYHKIGIQGTCPSVCPMLAGYGKHLGEHKYRYENNWAVMWQQHYLAALLQWDINTDVEKAWEEANALYYGAAWNNGMRDYRKLLIKISEETAGCHGYNRATRTSAGRCLTVPGAEARLLVYLDQAEKAAKGDPRVLAAIQIDRNFLNELWIRRNRKYVEEQVRKLSAYQTTEKIVIDGKLSESDWTKADIISSLKDKEGKAAIHPAGIRFMYDPDYLYVAMEVVEPEMRKIDSSRMELMLNNPDMNGKYFQFVISPKGLLGTNLVDGEKSKINFDAHAKVAVGKESDRWIVEMKLPAKALGTKIISGQSWRFNIKRYRAGKKTEVNSLVTGVNVRSVNTFLTFITDKVRVGIDTRAWRNSDFSEWQVLRKKPEKLELTDNKIPAFWILNKASGAIVMEAKEENPDDKYVTLTDARIYQQNKGTAKKCKVILDVKGTGSLKVYVNRYSGTTRRGLGADQIFTVKPSADQWKTFKAEYTKHDAGEILGVVLDVTGKVSVDNMFVFPVEDKGK